MRSNAVQFRGIEKTIKAYEMNEMPGWSMWNGKALMFCYDGDDMAEGANTLKAAMRMLQEGGGDAVYTLQFYKDPPAGGIKNKTEYDRSFNCSLYDEDSESAPHTTRWKAQQALEDRLDRLEKLLTKQAEDDEEEEEIGGVAGVLAGFMKVPVIQQAIAAKVVSIIEGLPGMGPKVGRVAGIENGPAPAEAQALESDQVEKLNRALEILAGKDPKIGDHLMAVAMIARDSPIKYKTMIAML